MHEAMLTFLAGSPHWMAQMGVWKRLLQLQISKRSSHHSLFSLLIQECFLQKINPNLKNQKTLHARLHVPVPHIPGLVYRYNSLLMEIRNRDTSEIHLEVLDAEKDKLRLECEYIKPKIKKSICRPGLCRDAEKFFKKLFFDLLITL